MTRPHLRSAVIMTLATGRLLLPAVALAQASAAGSTPPAAPQLTATSPVPSATTPVVGGAPTSPVISGAAATAEAGRLANAPVTAYTREVFQYARAGRPDPVAPPPEVFRRDRFPTLTLTGILFDAANPRESAAMVVVQRLGADGKPSGVGTRRLVRIGDTFEAYAILKIEPKAVLVQKSVLGRKEQFVLRKSARRVVAQPDTAASVEAPAEAVTPRRPDRPRLAGQGVTSPAATAPAAPAAPPPSVPVGSPSGLGRRP